VNRLFLGSRESEPGSGGPGGEIWLFKCKGHLAYETRQGTGRGSCTMITMDVPGLGNGLNKAKSGGAWGDGINGHPR